MMSRFYFSNKHHHHCHSSMLLAGIQGREKNKWRCKNEYRCYKRFGKVLSNI